MGGVRLLSSSATGLQQPRECVILPEPRLTRPGGCSALGRVNNDSAWPGHQTAGETGGWLVG